MKHIKRFETLHYDNDNLDLKYFKFKIGDIVKLTPAKRKYLKSNIGFREISDIFKISIIDDYAHTHLTYYITALNNDYENYWLRESDIVKASEEEISANKYNL